MFSHLLKQEAVRRHTLAAGYIVPDPARCVQCGICSFNCPQGIDVRHHVWLGKPIKDGNCLSCGECVTRCPRGVLTFEKSSLFDSDRSQANN